MLTQQQLDQFDRDGYLIVEDILDEDELASIWAEYEEIIDRIGGQLAAAGEIAPLTGSGFSEKYIEAIGQIDQLYDLYQHLDISLPVFEELEPDATMNAGPAAFSLLTNPRLLDVAEQFVGPEIFSNPTQHARIKPPISCLPRDSDNNVAATQWHQDVGFVEEDAIATETLTVWLAITDANVDNGCLVAVPESHHAAESLHCPGKLADPTIYIPQSSIDQGRVVPLEVKAGGAVLLHRMTQHASLDNSTDQIRWSFDLRYQPTGLPTGRSFFPGFVVRSAANPQSVVDNHKDWAELWWTTRDRIADDGAEITFYKRYLQNKGLTACA